ncbi:MAG: hypothetical protein ABIF88_01965 [archaeon]
MKRRRPVLNDNVFREKEATTTKQATRKKATKKKAITKQANPEEGSVDHTKLNVHLQ